MPISRKSSMKKPKVRVTSPSVTYTYSHAQPTLMSPNSQHRENLDFLIQQRQRAEVIKEQRSILKTGVQNAVMDHKDRIMRMEQQLQQIAQTRGIDLGPMPNMSLHASSYSDNRMGHKTKLAMPQDQQRYYKPAFTNGRDSRTSQNSQHFGYTRPSICGESTINDHNGSIDVNGMFARDSQVGFYDDQQNEIHHQSRDSCLVAPDNFQFQSPTSNQQRSPMRKGLLEQTGQRIQQTVAQRKEIMKDHNRKITPYFHHAQNTQSYMPSNNGNSIDFRSNTFDHDDAADLLGGVPPYIMQTHEQALNNDRRLRVQTHKGLQRSRSHRDILEETYDRINQTTVKRGNEAKTAIASIEGEIRGLKSHLGRLKSTQGRGFNNQVQDRAKKSFEKIKTKYAKDINLIQQRAVDQNSHILSNSDLVNKRDCTTEKVNVNKPVLIKLADSQQIRKLQASENRLSVKDAELKDKVNQLKRNQNLSPQKRQNKWQFEQKSPSPQKVMRSKENRLADKYAYLTQSEPQQNHGPTFNYSDMLREKAELKQKAKVGYKPQMKNSLADQIRSQTEQRMKKLRLV